jgi:hypothetical protein
VPRPEKTGHRPRPQRPKKSAREISLKEFKEIEELARNQFSADRMLASVAAARGWELRSRMVDPGPDPEDDEALDHLSKMLIRATEMCDRHPDKKRLASIFALDAVLFFLMRVREWQAPRLMRCLCELQCALVDLERGAELPPLLQQKPKRARRPASSLHENFKGSAAAAMSTLMKVGKTREEAARLVVNVLHRSGVKLGGRRQLRWGTIASWRDQVRKAAPSKDEAAFHYQLLLESGDLMGMPAVPANMEPEQRERFVREVLLSLSGHVKDQI